jgi:O-antigen ligase
MEKDAKTPMRYLSMDGLIQWFSASAAKHRLSALIVIGVLFGAAFLGRRASTGWLLLLFAVAGALVLLRMPQLGLLAVIAAALVVRVQIGTGTEVQLNVATLLIPALFGLWLLESLRRRKLEWAGSSANRPLILFLIAGLASLIIGQALWDPAVPVSGRFWLVQLAQWAIFLFAAMAFWLVANLPEGRTWLPRLTWFFLYLGGGLAILLAIPGMRNFAEPIITLTFIRAPFWVLLTALAAGQLLFNTKLGLARQAYLVAVMAAVIVYGFFIMDNRTSNWLGIVSVIGVLVWLRLRSLRITMFVLMGLVLVVALLSGFLYEFAGGDEKWDESGASRLVLIERVVSVTMRNPITGLGPAAYRPYANVKPLRYQGALWWNPQINSHNNYVDLFAHGGILGLALFFWFAVELGLVGVRVSDRHRTGFDGGYVNGMTAAWVGSLVIMMLADWMLPFVYNIGFPGFQASILVWLFLGGIVAVDARGHPDE